MYKIQENYKCHEGCHKIVIKQNLGNGLDQFYSKFDINYSKKDSFILKTAVFFYFLTYCRPRNVLREPVVILNSGFSKEI